MIIYIPKKHWEEILSTNGDELINVNLYHTQKSGRIALNVKVEPQYTTGHCAEKQKAGGCQLHNLQCGWPECDRRLIP